MLIARNHFDRSKPFYPLIMNYISALHGIKSLLLEGVLLGHPLTTKRDVNRYFRDPSKVDDELRKGVGKLIGPLELVCNCGEPPVVIGHDETAKEYLDNHLYLFETLGRHAATGLLVMAWETTEAFHDQKPLWEFLRHSRNAAAHNGRWHFVGTEPKRPAEWTKFRLDASLHGKPLFEIPKEPGMLKLGDPISLLWDIEQAYPTMKV